MNGVRKYIVLTIIFIAMLGCFWFKSSEGGWACTALFICIWSITNPIKEINYKAGTISFENLEIAKILMKSPDWLKYSLNIKNIEQNQVDIYINLRLQRSLQLTSPFNEYHKKTVNTLSEYKKYRDMGYYPFATIDMIEASNYEILTVFFDLFKNAKKIKCSNQTLKQIVPSLPANEIQFLCPMDEIEKHRDKNIKEFLKREKVSITTQAKEYDIEYDTKDVITFTELLRADFYNKGFEEIFIVKYYRSCGSFQIFEPLLLRNVNGSYFVLPIKDKKPLKLKLINFITKSRYTGFLYKIICFFVKDNVDKDYFSKWDD